jgi:hypothetical protein
MSKLMKVLKIAGIVGGVALVGIFFGWLGSRGPAIAPPPALAPAPTAVETAPVSPAPAPASAQLAPIPAPVAARVSNAPEVASSGAGQMTNWLDKLEEILNSPAGSSDKAKEMLAMFPHLSEEGQIEVARHLSNLVPNEDYSALGKYLTNSTMPEPVLEVLLQSLLNRPNGLKLPLLLQVARDEQNPKAAEAKGLLQVFLEDDYGKDWNRWQAKMDQWLKDNPD